MTFVEKIINFIFVILTYDDTIQYIVTYLGCVTIDVVWIGELDVLTTSIHHFLN
jgi:hypothetical protein